MRHTSAPTHVLLIWEVQSHINVNIFSSSNITLHNLQHHVVFSSPDFPANITPQPLLDLMLSAKVYLNTSFCLVLHNTLWPVHQINYQINLIFTAPYPSLARASIPIPSPHLVPPTRFTFSNHIPISHMSQLTTHATHIPSIYGVRMPSQHSEPARIHNNTISKFIPRHHYDKETSTFR